MAASGSEGAYLTANTAWWQQQKLPMDRINLYTCKNSDTVSYAFYAREVQLLRCDLSNTASTGTVSSADFTDADTTVLHYLGFHTTRAPFNKPTCAGREPGHRPRLAASAPSSWATVRWPSSR